MPQSAETGGGSGFTYEGDAAAYYLAAMLAEAHAAGVDDRIVVRVAVQQREMGEPLDDVIVDFRDRFSGLARLSLQVKRLLKVSKAPSNTDFRELIRDSRATLAKPDFRIGVDRYGAAVGTISAEKFRALNELCDIARASPSASEFDCRFCQKGNAPANVKSVRADVVALLDEYDGRSCSPEYIHTFLAHFLLIRFDFLHPGAAEPPDAINRIQGSLEDTDADKSSLVWSRLIEWARAGAGRSERFNRQSLVRRLAPLVRLRGAPSLRADLEKLAMLAGHYAGNIQDDVGGERLGREALQAELEEQLTIGRLVQIRGLPGSGKSVLIRKAVERAIGQGSVIFLKGDQIEGRSWNSFASSQGLSGVSLERLLIEIGATGTSILYIDAIDRVAKEHQPVILDVANTIIKSPQLSDWRIVVTVRDSAIELLRNWLRDILDAITVRTVEVGQLSGEEAEALALAKPHLRPVLFGPHQVRTIARRPFFAKVMDQSFAADPTGATFAPQSEIDLIENWWRRGGHDATGRAAFERQRAILDLARVRARQMSLPIGYSQLSSTAQVQGLIEDGILQEARAGHSVRFAHDIFFEWSFFHALVDRDHHWLEEVRAAGEPPAVARAVELLSQWAYADGRSWKKLLAATEATDLRSQWMRSWLIGPLGSPAFDKDPVQFESAVFAREFALLRKVLVWFQAEKTTPNPVVLVADHIPPDQRQRFADALGWPSDFGAWRRLITLLINHSAEIPRALYPDVVAVFEVWQNAGFNHVNETSTRLLGQCADWLRELDAIASAERPIAFSERWKPLPHFDDFRSSLMRLILRAAASEPEPANQLLQRRMGSRNKLLREKEFAAVVAQSSMLAGSHAALLVDLAIGKLRAELPDARVAREREEVKTTAERRKALLEKPTAERTPLDQRMMGAPDFRRVGSDFSHHDWQELSIEQMFEPFSPPSPLREPFHSLFQYSPVEALRLLREISNHAIMAWRQLHRYSHDRPGTPIPLEIEFPWGAQLFWGTEREYLWCRGMWAPDAVSCGFLALENWCFGQLAAGVPLDGLIMQIVEGHECVAILGTAVALALETEVSSEAVLPLIASQRLWSADHHRFGQDLSSSNASLIGFRGRDDLPHVEAIRAINNRAIRKRQLRWLAQRYVALGGESFSERARHSIGRFKDHLPYQYEEWRDIPEAREQLLAQALEYEEAADPSTYKAYRASETSKELVIVHESPTAAAPESVARVERARIALHEGALWAWIDSAFESGRLGEGCTIAAAVKLAKRLDGADLFGERGKDVDDGIGIRRGTVTGAAAIVLSFRDGLSADDLDWARAVLRRASVAPQLMSEFLDPRSVIPWHEGILVARGLSADVRAGTADSGAAEHLLSLVGHPLEVVSLAALDQCCTLWPVDPRLAWTAIHIAFTLCHVKPRSEREMRSRSDAIHSPADVRRIIGHANGDYWEGKDWKPLPGPPAAWVKLDSTSRQSNEATGRYDEDYDEHDLEDPRDVWVEPEGLWYAQYAAKLLPSLPIASIMDSGAKGLFLEFVAELLHYTNQKNAPPWVKSGRRNQSASQFYEWTSELGRTIARVAGQLPLTEFRPRFLEHILALEGDNCWALLSPFVSTYVCAYVYDATEIPPDAIAILELCLDRLLSSRVFDPTSYRSGELSGFDQPQLVKTLMFVSVEHASAAARYVNGDWKEIDRILPLVDRFVRAAGWSSNVMGLFLTFCERAKSSYPAEAFANQLLAVLRDEARPLKRWSGTFIPARIAELVQHFAAQETRLPLPLGQKFLRILDMLVDLGDRRSAALQLSEAFREIRAGA